MDLAQGKIDLAKFRLTEIKKLLPEFQGITKNEIEFRYHFLSTEVLLAESKTQKAIININKNSSQSVTDAEFFRNLRYNLPFLKDQLARAYYKNGELDKAIVEYERLTNFDPKNKNRYLIHPRYYCLLGKLYEENGAKSKATTRYGKFIALWKNADKGLPELIDAKSRYAKLKDVIEK